MIVLFFPKDSQKKARREGSIPSEDIKQFGKNMKKSITIVGKVVDHAYVIRDIDIDKITLDQYSVECSSGIVDAWGASSSEQISFLEPGEQVLEVVLKEKINHVTLTARAPVIEMASRMGGKIIKDIKVERAKRGKKVYLSDIILFKEKFEGGNNK